MAKSEKGIVLVSALCFTLVLTILGFSVLIIAGTEISLTRNAVNKTKAFYLAEAGLEIFASGCYDGVGESVEETILGDGSYRVDYYYDEDPVYAVAIGTVGGQEKRIKVTVCFLAPPYEKGIYAGGVGEGSWTLILGGEGDPISKSGGEYSGKDIINGNVYVKGDVAMYQESSVNPPLGANPYDLEGDVDATGNIDLYDSSTVSGDINEGAELQNAPDLVGMNYHINNTHNVTQIFIDEETTQGCLPTGHELRDVFQINPSNMTAECASTDGDDFFLTPVSGFIGGTWQTAPTPLHLGNDNIYYVDGDVWVHSKSTYGFTMDGKVTIVATGDIHLCDNFVYADSNSMLGLVALGKYNEYEELVSGGNVYFGDPTTGTLYEASAMMFAANNFLYNSIAVGSFSGEPESGFTVNGNISALNEVSIERDWYSKYEYEEVRVRVGHSWQWVWQWVETECRPACYRYDTEEGGWEWVDAVTGEELTEIEINGDEDTDRKPLRHYQMIVNYDDRVRSRSTQPPGLPRGVGLIFDGLTDWEELP